MSFTTRPRTFARAEDALAHLARTPRALDTLLRGLPDSWAAANEGGDTWSPIDVVAHLMHTVRTNWIPRMRLVGQHGDSRPFDEFDRFGHQVFRPAALPALLDEFAAIREDSLRELRARAAADLDRRGQHPVMGVVTFRQLLAAWVTHDLDHLMQVTRVLALQYTDEVGPWRQYLRIVRDIP
jgi:hypothetical protein